MKKIKYEKNMRAEKLYPRKHLTSFLTIRRRQLRQGKVDLFGLSNLFFLKC